MITVWCKVSSKAQLRERRKPLNISHWTELETCKLWLASFIRGTISQTRLYSNSLSFPSRVERHHQKWAWCAEGCLVTVKGSLQPPKSSPGLKESLLSLPHTDKTLYICWVHYIYNVEIFVLMYLQGHRGQWPSSGAVSVCPALSSPGWREQVWPDTDL